MGKDSVGAAIAAGALLAFVYAEPTLQATVIPKLGELAAAAGSAVAGALSWIGQNVIGGVDTAALENSTGLVGSVMKHPGVYAATSAAAGGLIASRMGQVEPALAEVPVRAERSFASREDAQAMQAIMLARMQEQGYHPAASCSKCK